MCGKYTEPPWLKRSLLKKGLGKTPLPDGKSMKKEDSLTGRLTNYNCTMGKQSGTIHMTLNP